MGAETPALQVFAVVKKYVLAFPEAFAVPTSAIASAADVKTGRTQTKMFIWKSNKFLITHTPVAMILRQHNWVETHSGTRFYSTNFWNVMVT